MGTLSEYPFSLTVLLTDPTEEDAKKAIKAKVKQADGVEIDLTYGTDYSVSLNTDRSGGIVSVTDKRTSDDYITIYREYDETQEADYQDFNAAPADTYEQCFDKLTMLCQQQQEQIDRSVKVGMTSNISPEVVTQQVERIYQSIDNVDTVADNQSSVNTVADSIENVNAVSENIANVNKTGANINNVNTAAQNVTAINDCADNIEAIIDAPAQATIAADSAQSALSSKESALASASSAAQSEDNAQIWAEGTDEQVQALGGEHSSKGWADVSSGGGANTDLSNITEAGKEVIRENAGTGFNMFDFVVKDHILSFEESKGLGLQGTYVYKEAVTGSRYGYPDFYNKCVEEKTASVNTTILTTPNVTNQGCYISRDYIVDGFSTRNYVQPSTGFNPESNPWEIVIKFTTGSSFNNYQGLMGSTDSAQNNGLRTIIDANGSLLYYGSSNNSSPNLMDAVRSTINLAINTTYYLKAEYTGTQYIFSFSSNGETYTPDTTVSQTTPVSIRSFCFGNDLWGASNQYPFLGSIDLTGCYIKISDEIVWQGVNSLNLLKNANGHYFYDIADKDAVDEFYQENGEAWFYGVDATNERIFLPRTTRFQYTSDTSKVGACQEAGLPDIEGTFYQYRYVDATGAFKLGESKGVDTIGGGGAIFSATNTSFEASRSNPIYGNSETVTPAATNQLLYIVVGNTEVESAATDIVDVTTTENDTIPLFTGMYYDFTPNNPSWLKAGQQANNGGLYVSAYSKLVNELTDPVYNLKVIDVSDMESNVDYSEYWKVDQDAQTFTTPIRTGERILVAKKEATASDPTWYNWYSDGWLEQGGNLNQSGSATVTYPKAYIDTNYTVVVTLPFNDASSVTSHVRTDTKTVNSFSTVGGSINGIWWQTSGYSTKPSLSDYTENVKLYFKVANAVENLDLIDLGEITEALADKTDMAQAAKAPLPSNRIIDLTIPQNGTALTMPADGWLSFNARQTTTGISAGLHNTGRYMAMHAPQTSNGFSYNCYSFLPVRKGDSVLVQYEAINTDQSLESPSFLKFIYAEGAENV